MLSDLHGLSQRWFRAWFEKDDVTVERLMAEDYVYIAPNGLVLDRKAILGIIRSATYRLNQGERTEVVVRPLGRDAAVIRDRWQGAGSFDGIAFTDDHRCIRIWEMRVGEWRLVMEQCSFANK